MAYHTNASAEPFDVVGQITCVRSVSGQLGRILFVLFTGRGGLSEHLLSQEVVDVGLIFVVVLLSIRINIVSYTPHHITTLYYNN